MFTGLEFGKRDDQYPGPGKTGALQDLGFTAIAIEYRFTSLTRLGDNVGIDFECDEWNTDPSQELCEILRGAAKPA